MNRPIRVKIIHRNRLFRECLVKVLSNSEQFAVTEIDHRDAGALKSVEANPPDVLLVDLNLPEQQAIALTEFVRERVAGTKVIVLTFTNAHESLFECIAAGADGCVLQDVSLQDLQVAIEKVIGGENYCSPEIVCSMFRRLAEKMPGSDRTGRAAQTVTPREREILGLIADGLSNKQIAKRLCLSLYTVKNHLHHIMEKLGVDSRFNAVEYARQRRWLKTAPSSRC